MYLSPRIALVILENRLKKNEVERRQIARTKG